MKLIQLMVGEEKPIIGTPTSDDRVANLTAAGAPSRIEEWIASSRNLDDFLFRLQPLATAAPLIEHLSFSELIQDGFHENHRIALPVRPAEVWGVAPAAHPVGEPDDELEGPSLNGSNPESSDPDRPGIFFKATAARCSAHREPVNIRSDSSITLATPKLALVLGHAGEVVGFTAGCDLTAHDLLRQGAQFGPQARTFLGCCSIGPILVTPDEIGNPRDVTISIAVKRKKKIVFENTGRTNQMPQSTKEITRYLLRDNLIVPGTVVLVDVGITPPESSALRHGDTIAVAIDTIGTLANPAHKLLTY